MSIISSLPFDEVLGRIGRGVGHPEMNRFRDAMRDARALSELEEIVECAIGPSGLMQFSSHDLVAVVRKEGGSATPKNVRLIVGNPLIMNEMVKRAPDAGASAPVTILIDERSDGVHLSYDRLQSLLANGSGYKGRAPPGCRRQECVLRHRGVASHWSNSRKDSERIIVRTSTGPQLIADPRICARDPVPPLKMRRFRSML
jgi:uncharacterized protein (DUF302 family)